MPLSQEERIELLKKAREVKKVKQEERKAEKLKNPPKKKTCKCTCKCMSDNN